MNGICERCGKKTTFEWERHCWKCQNEIDLEERKKAISEGDESSIYYDTASEDYIICPWCGNAFAPDVEDDDGDEFECDECGKKFVLEVEWTATYSTKKGE